MPSQLWRRAREQEARQESSEASARAPGARLGSCACPTGTRVQGEEDRRAALWRLRPPGQPQAVVAFTSTTGAPSLGTTGYSPQASRPLHAPHTP